MSNIVGVLSKIPNIIEELQKVVPCLIFKDATTENDTISKCEIIVADFQLLIPHIHDLNKTKWIQGTWAGVKNFLPHFTKDNFEGKIVTRFSGRHLARMMSEYVTTHIINYERNIFQIKQNQENRLWCDVGKIGQHRTISDLNIGILGIGIIGNQIAQTLNHFGGKISGFGKRDCLPDDDKYKIYQDYYVRDTLPVLLKNCDYVVNVLPSTNETKGLLNGDMLKNCSTKETVFINIGRGDIINETDLINALENNWITHAIIDVFQNEPLPQESPLWNYKQVLITPHVAGASRAQNIAEQFKENYELYKKGLPISTQLEYDKKY